MFSRLIVSFLESETRPFENVPVVVLADAKFHDVFGSSLEGPERTLFRWVKQLVVSAGRRPQAVEYTFGKRNNNWSRTYDSLNEPGAIVVLSGNAFELNEALLSAPHFRNLLIERVKSGRVFY